jgi:hypothetical protein
LEGTEHIANANLDQPPQLQDFLYRLISIIKLNSYLYIANLTAQRPSAKLARIKKRKGTYKKQNTETKQFMK